VSRRPLGNFCLLSVSRSSSADNTRPRINFQGDWLLEMGLTLGALVQVLPEPNGMVFNLCNENISSYSELMNSTREQGGSLIRVCFADKKTYKELTFQTSGKHIYSGGLKIGDALIAQYDYGIIRVRKIAAKNLGFKSVKIIQMTYRKDKYTGILIPKLRLSGSWLNDIGFTAHELVTAESEQDIITFKVQENGMSNYKDLVKYARQNKMKLLQIREEAGLPNLMTTGSLVENAGFEITDALAASYEDGIIKLQKLDFEKLGF
jgi:hypothetical protein